MKKFGLIGYPLEHSFSAKYFDEKFKAEKIDAEYHLFPIQSIKELPQLIASEPNLVGLNVTSPYKREVLKYLHHIDFEAEMAGAVNVIKIEKGFFGKKSLIGYNSDIIGFKDSLQNMDLSGVDRALVLGTGGASIAICRALKLMSISHDVVSRAPQRDNILSYSQITPAIVKDKYRLIINATTLGMYPHVNECPPIPYESLTNKHICYDLIYNPETTLFLEKAASHGAITKNGLQMLLIQAEESWRIWNQL